MKYTETASGMLRGENGHEYPSDYTPDMVEQYWSMVVAWQILDLIKPGLIDGSTRAFLAGLIAGSLELAAKSQKPSND